MRGSWVEFMIGNQAKPAEWLGTEIVRLSKRLGHGPTASQLADELGMDREEIIHVLLAGRSYSMALTGTGQGGSDVASSAIAAIGVIDEDLVGIENREALRASLAALSERERVAIVLRLFKSQSQSQIADRIGISPIQVSRLLATALEKLRQSAISPPVAV